MEMLGFLSDTYYIEPPVRNMVVTTGIKPATITFGQPMKLVWADIFEKARNQDKLRDLLDVIMSGADAAVAARLREWLEADPPITAQLPAGDGLAWKGHEGEDGFERQIYSEPTLLDVAFLRRGAELAPAVCRLQVKMPSGRKFLGTAFRVSEHLLLTNHHVLFDLRAGSAPASAVEVWFGYERTFAGEELAYHEAHGDPASIQGDPTHDWAVIEVGSDMAADVPIIGLTGAGPVSPEDRVYIIQHPRGAPKKIGMVHNVVRHVDDDVVQYLTDTEGGSSGAPVFDERWELVALHHRWIEHRSAGRTEYRNQGRRIERVVDALERASLI